MANKSKNEGKNAGGGKSSPPFALIGLGVFALGLLLLLVIFFMKDTLFQHYIRQGNLVHSKQFLVLGADINLKDEKGNTALHLTVKKGNGQIVRFLLANGARVNLKDKEGHTPLHLAVKYKMMSVARILLSNGADSNALNSHKQSPLHVVCTMQLPKITKLLLSYEGDLKALDLHGNTPLHYAAGVRSNSEVIQILIRAGAHIDTVNHKDQTPLYIAISKGDEYNVTTLLKFKPSVEIVNKEGLDALKLARKGKNQFIIDSILRTIEKRKSKSKGKLFQSSHKK